MSEGRPDPLPPPPPPPPPQPPSPACSFASIYYYDPYARRVVEKPLNTLDAFISLLKCVIGTGILAMPLAFYYSGIILGVLMMTLLMVLLTYCIHLLIRGMTECCRRTQVPQVSMPEAMQIAYELGPKCCHKIARLASHLTSSVLVFGQFDLCTVYLVFVAKNFKQVGDYYDSEIHESFYVLGTCVLLLPLFMIRKLKYLVPVNFISNVLLYAGFLSIMYYLFTGLPRIQERELFRQDAQYVEFLSLAAFSLTSVGAMLVVEANMARPEKYLGMCGVLNLSVLVILLSNIFFGLLGYWRYGQDVAASITLNIPSGKIFSQFINLSIAGGIFLSYPLNGYVAITVIFSDYLGDPNKKRLWLEYLVRVIFLICTGIVASVVPNLEALTALEGAFSLSNLNLFCPAIIDIMLNYEVGYGKLRWKLIRDVMFILIAIAFGIIGCTVAILQLIADFKVTLSGGGDGS